MRVQEIAIDNKKAYLLLDTNGMPIVPVEKYMKYLHNKESSSNTLHKLLAGLVKDY